MKNIDKIKSLLVLLFFLPSLLMAQTYPFILPATVTAELNVETTNTEDFKNTLLGYNIEGFNTNLQKDFIRLVDPITIRFPHGVWANFYEWQDDTYQQDSYDNGTHQATLDIYVDRIKGHIGGIAALNKERVDAGRKGFDMMWTYSINFDDGASSVARAKKDIALGLEVKDIELGNEHFWKNQRSNRTATEADYLREAKAVSAALKDEFPDIRVSIPLSWRHAQAGTTINHAAYNAAIADDGSYFDALSIHKYLGADPDQPGESNSAYEALLTAKLELAEDVNWVRDNYGPGKPIWLTEWGVSAGSDVHGAACLGMADAYLYMAENQQVFDRANWFSFNRVLNAMVVVGSNREPVYPLQKRGYLSTYEILHSVLKDATLLKSNVSSSAQLTTTRGSVNAVNARAVTKDGNTTVIAINLSDKPVEFTLKFDNIVYGGSFKHEALKFDNVGVIDPIDFYSNPLTLVKSGSGTITLPPLSISKITEVTLDPTVKFIPGTIEAEDYKSGGEGVGYSDTTLGNSLNASSFADGVDVGIFNSTTYVGGTQTGEWLKYDVNVLQDGDYDVEFLYAAATAGSISLEIDDIGIFKNHELQSTPNNGADFQLSPKVSIDLAQGQHNLKIKVEKGGFNLDKMNFIYVVPPPAPSFVSPANGAIILPGSDIEVEASTTLGSSEIKSMELFINDVSVRLLNTGPFKWGYAGLGDTLLENIAEGDYTLKLVLTNVRDNTSETVIVVNSQAGVTQPFSGALHQVPGKIEVEDYDLGGEGFAYHDSSLGNDTSGYRTENDVDLTTGGSGIVSNALSGGEYTRYSINVTESGSYHMLVNYKTSSSTSKPFAAALLPIDLSSSRTLFSQAAGSTTSGIIHTGGTYKDYVSINFDLDAGFWVLELQIPNGGAGPNYDYVTLVREGTLGVEDDVLLTKQLVLYPMPSNTGIFNLSESTSWEVYSMLGVKVMQGEGVLVDISKFPKGMYILRTEKGISKRLFFQ
ncbi:Por secretion system C-terminal sorting domain-containing protein [Lutibacter agarilyticus]|uniref:Por secretion system C-terminal sorting domain-containing protein n=1 Tax=Lutibacter agarilyticus TaxID=1109740 RepID=A0A238Z138_9FLAO|nr:carbohydrate-binding protein [Lutibacter agarilyticus]SNR76982.1 Por secretion system C-terminal sorting domain-containing protein [Lutibacter agarilyticus]